MDVLWCIHALSIIEYVLLIITDPPHSERRKSHTDNSVHNRQNIGTVFSLFLSLDISLIETEEAEVSYHVQYCEV